MGILPHFNDFSGGNRIRLLITLFLENESPIENFGATVYRI